MQSIQIRNTEETDADQLAVLMEQLGFPLTSPDMLKRIKIYHANPNYFSYVAEKDQHLVGSVSLAITEQFHRQIRFCRIISLVVDQQYRKLGIGKALIQYAEHITKENGCEFMEVASAVHRAPMGAHDFYLSLGFNEAIVEKKYFLKKIC